MKNIFDLTQEYAEIEALLIENEGLLDEDLEARLKINREELTAKGEGYHAIINKNKREAAMIDEEIKRLSGLKKVRENAAERLKERLLEAMRLYDVKKIPLLTGSITLVQTEKIDVVDENEIPERFFKTVTTTTLQKAEVNKAVKDGEDVPGVAKTFGCHLLIK